MSSENRIFTDEELKDLGTRTIDKAKAAIDAGDAEAAKALVDQMYAQWKFLHDGYFTWVSGLQTWIYEHHGVEELEAAEREAHMIESRLVFIPQDEPDFKKAVAGFATGLHGHIDQPMTVTEDDEKVTVTVGPCGSGGRLQEMGGYEPEIGLAKVKEACPITWGYEDFPMYCIHCPVMTMQDFERCGDFTFVRGFHDGKPGSCCDYHFYKDKKDIPDMYYEQLGKTRPANQ